MYRIGNYGIRVFRSQRSMIPKSQATKFQTYDFIRRNSSQSGMSKDVFKGDIPLEKYLTTQLMAARKTRDAFRTNVLRTVIGEIQTEQKLLSTLQGMSSEKLEQSALKSVRKAISKRKAAAAEYRSSNLPDAAELEDQESTFLEALLPKQLDRDQLRETVGETYTTAMKDGVFGGEGPPNVQAILKIMTERVEDAHGKGSVSKGDIAGLIMPLLQRDGVLKGSKKAK